MERCDLSLARPWSADGPSLRDRVRLRDEEDEREPREAERALREVRAPDPMDPRDLKGRDPELRLSSPRSRSPRSPRSPSPRSSCTANPELSVSEANLDIDCRDSRDSPDLATGEVSDPRRPEPDDWWPAQDSLFVHNVFVQRLSLAGRGPLCTPSVGTIPGDRNCTGRRQRDSDKSETG